jgi:hypothetical protein
LDFSSGPQYFLAKQTITQKRGAVMKRRLSQAIGYLFIPEDSVGQKAPTLVASPARKSFAGVSLKAAFWAGMAVAVALMLGRLS